MTLNTRTEESVPEVASVRPPASSDEDASAESRAALRRALLSHYDEHRRRLPWRGETDPYRILVSEVMLQQTRVETVLDYYGPWLERFPDVESLAAAGQDEVLGAWQGLGYYRRAQNLHRAARVVRERPDRSLPSTYEELRALPGVGEYTAGAVASIAFGERVPAPDGNVRRVLARLYDVADPKPAWLRETARSLVDPERPGDWNQALMELGATVCKPRGPACDQCPVEAWCAAHAAGTQDDRPAATSRRPPRKTVFVVAVVHGDGRVLLERRPADGLLGGLWAFPEVEVEDAGGAREAALGVVRGLGASGVVGGGAVATSVQALPECEHRFTHLHATYLPYLVDVGGRRGGGDRVAELRWVDLGGPPGVALPVAQRRIMESARDHVAGRSA